MSIDATGLPLEGYEQPMPCPICQGGPLQANCPACAGRGVIDSIPYADRPWDLITDGLWLGGHDCQQGYCYPGNLFNVVVSMTHIPHALGGAPFEPDEASRHYLASIRDEGQDLDEIAEPLDRLAERIILHLKQGESVLVRCWAGLNRAALVVGLVLVKQGMSPEEAIALIRHKRSPYALFNASFADYLRAQS